MVYVLTKYKADLLFSELLGDILGRAAGHVNPGLAEEGATTEHEADVKDGVDWVGQDGAKRLRRREIVTETSDRVSPARSGVIPHS